MKGQLCIIGGLAGRKAARDFAEEVRRVHHRYATEVVGAFRLCPHMKEPESAFGQFVVVLERETRIDAAAEVVIAAGSQVTHLVYPLLEIGPAPFERFGNAVHAQVARVAGGGPVHATFHPHMDGDASTASRLVGLLRHAPDPFVQFVPEGLHEGGTVFADLASVDLLAFAAQKDNAAGNFARLSPANIDSIKSILADIRSDRDRSYARYGDALGGG